MPKANDVLDRYTHVMPVVDSGQDAGVEVNRESNSFVNLVWSNVTSRKYRFFVEDDVYFEETDSSFTQFSFFFCLNHCCIGAYINYRKLVLYSVLRASIRNTYNLTGIPIIFRSALFRCPFFTNVFLTLCFIRLRLKPLPLNSRAYRWAPCHSIPVRSKTTRRCVWYRRRYVRGVKICAPIFSESVDRGFLPPLSFVEKKPKTPSEYNPFTAVFLNLF